MNKKIVILVIVLLVMLMVGFIWAYQRRFEQGERPLDPETEENAVQEISGVQRDRLINEYLAEFYGRKNFDGRVYCEHEYWGSSQKNDEVRYYLWAFCQEYYLDAESNVTPGLSVGGPVILTVRMVEGQPVIVEHRAFEDDREGALEAFPEIYHHRLEDGQERQSRMESAVLRSAERELLPGMGK